MHPFVRPFSFYMVGGSGGGLRSLWFLYVANRAGFALIAVVLIVLTPEPATTVRGEHNTYTVAGFTGARLISRMSPWCTVAT